MFKVISKEEPRPDEFDNVRDKVNVDWRSWARDQRKEAYMDSLLNTIDHTVNKRALEITFPHTVWAGEGDAGDQSDS